MDGRGNETIVVQLHGKICQMSIALLPKITIQILHELCQMRTKYLIKSCNHVPVSLRGQFTKNTIRALLRSFLSIGTEIRFLVALLTFLSRIT